MNEHVTGWDVLVILFWVFIGGPIVLKLVFGTIIRLMRHPK